METVVEESVKEKWLKIWNLLGGRIIKLPSEMQEILLSDLLTVIQNRLVVFERVNGEIP